MESTKYIFAARHLYKTDCSIEDFCIYCDAEEISIEWAIAAWVSIKATQGKMGKFPRYLEPNMLGQIKLTNSNRCCRLCGEEVPPPKYTWHTECWKALEPFTSIGWQKQLNTALRKCRNCQGCGKSASLEGDHIIPVALGGLPYLNNLQLLCSECHKAKSVIDNKAIRQAKSTSDLIE